MQNVKYIHKIKNKIIKYEETVYSPYEYNRDRIPEHSIPVVSKKDHNGNLIAYPRNTFITFDIETTSFTNSAGIREGFMYSFQMYDGEQVILGRTWEEFQWLLEQIKKKYGLCESFRMVIYVHFLSYEFQFIQSFVEIEEVFAKNVRKVINAKIGHGFEFRCSWFLSNMSLAKLCETFHVKHQKLSGEKFDYSVMRTPSTKLSEYEIGYAINDVIGLHEAISIYLIDDTLASIPMTSTGFVRRDCRRAFFRNKNNYFNFQRERLSTGAYIACTEAFRGGDCAANRYHTDCVIHNIGSDDYSSDYPYEMATNYYPVGREYIYEGTDIEKFNSLCEKYCVIAKYEFFGIKLYDKYPNIYIDLGHVKSYRNIEVVNGRILSADYIEIYLTEVDMRIIKEIYSIESYSVSNVYYWRRGKIEDEIISVMLLYIQKKTELKGIIESLYEYAKSKNKLNAIFGMFVSLLVHDEIIYNAGEWSRNKNTKIEESIEDYYNNPSSFLSYQKGVYITAHAREKLNRKLIKYGHNAVYWDTDSIKGKKTEDVKKMIEEYNKKVMSHNICYKNKNGILNYIGLFEDEGIYNTFKTLGPKSYAYEKNNEYHITVSGMDGKKAVEEIMEKIIPKFGGSFYDWFSNGTIFNDIGRTTMTYNDEIERRRITINKEEIITGANVGSVESTYTLSISDSYDIFKGVLDVLDKENNKLG